MNLGWWSHFLKTLLEIWVTTCARLSYFVVGLLLTFATISVFYAKNDLKINTDTSSLLNSDLQFRKDYKKFREVFPQLEAPVVIVLEGGSAEELRDATEFLVDELSSDGSSFKKVEALSLDPFWEHQALLFLQKERFQKVKTELEQKAPLFKALTNQANLEGWLGLLVRDSTILETEEWKTFFQSWSSSGKDKAEQNFSWQGGNSGRKEKSRTHLVTLSLAQDFSTLKPSKLSLQKLTKKIEQLRSRWPMVGTQMTGKTVLNTEELRSVTDGAKTSVIISLILVTLVLVFGLGSIKLVFAALVTLAIGLSLTAGFATLVVGSLNLISVAFAVLFIGLAIDFAIHFCLRFQSYREQGYAESLAMQETARHVGFALLICAPTTALAFYAFMPTAYVGLSQLGLISGTSMLIALFVSLTALPALLRIVNLQPRRDDWGDQRSTLGGLIQVLATPIGVISILLGVLAFYLVGDVKFEIDPLKLKDPKSSSVKNLVELANAGKISPYALQVILPLPEGDSVEQRTFVEGKVEQLRALSSVGKVKTIYEYLPQVSAGRELAIMDLRKKMDFLSNAVNTEKSKKKVALQSLERVKDKSAALVELEDFLNKSDEILYEKFEKALFQYFPRYVELLQRALDPKEMGLEKLPVAVRSRFMTDTYMRFEVWPQKGAPTQEELLDFVDQVRKTFPQATGQAIQIVEAGKTVAEAMQKATSLAFVLIALLLLVTLRSLRNTIVILLPLFLAGLWLGVATLVIGVPFNFANVIVLPLLIGLGVDGGIHLFLENQALTNDSEKLLTSSTSKAILLSSLTTIASFGSLSLSDHPGTASMGVLLTYSVIITLFATLILMPAFMSWIGKRSER